MVKQEKVTSGQRLRRAAVTLGIISGGSFGAGWLIGGMHDREESTVQAAINPVDIPPIYPIYTPQPDELGTPESVEVLNKTDFFETPVADKALVSLGMTWGDLYILPTGTDAWNGVIERLRVATDEQQAMAFPPGVRQWAPLVRKAIDVHKERTGIEYPLWFVLAIITQESQGLPESYRYEAHVDDGSYGLCQIMGHNLRYLGIDPAEYDDPLTNVDAALQVLDWNLGVTDHLSDPDFMYTPYSLAKVAIGYNAGPGMVNADHDTLAQYSVYPVVYGDNIQRMAISVALVKELSDRGYSHAQIVGMVRSRTADRIASMFNTLYGQYDGYTIYLDDGTIANATERYRLFLGMAVKYAQDPTLEQEIRLGSHENRTPVNLENIWVSTPDYQHPLDPVHRFLVNGYNPDLYLANTTNTPANFWVDTESLYRIYVLPFLRERNYRIPVTSSETSSAPPMNYGDYHALATESKVNPMSKRDFIAYQEYVSAGIIGPLNVSELRSRGDIASVVRIKLGISLTRAEIKKLTMAGSIGLNMLLGRIAQQVHPKLWPKAASDPIFIGVLSKTSGFRPDIVREALERGYSPTDIVRGVLPS